MEESSDEQNIQETNNVLEEETISKVEEIINETVIDNLENVEQQIEEITYREGDLTKEIINNNFHSLGRHPICYSHTYLGVNINNKQLLNITAIKNFPKLMYVDISGNSISSLEPLSNLPMLVQLNASSNEIQDCLNFSPPHCNRDTPWSTGHEACGSMLTLANLNNNKITEIHDLSHHMFLECLLLSKNMIRSIKGFNKLQYLQVLDISYNNLTKIEGLENLNIQELNLEGNFIEKLEGLTLLSRLTTLNVASNKISCLAPLNANNSLRTLNIKNNKVFSIRQTEFISELPWLQYLEMQGNPCCEKFNFRARVVFRLSKLLKLDRTVVSAEERVRAYNLYETDLGDLRARTEIFTKYLPNQEFKLYTPSFYDDEMDLNINDLMNEYDKEYAHQKLKIERDSISNYSNNYMDDVFKSIYSAYHD